MFLVHGFKFCYTKLILKFIVKNKDISLLCVLDSIHTQYASNVFQYLIFIFIQVLKKSVFYFKSYFLKNMVFVSRLNFYA